MNTSIKPAATVILMRDADEEFEIFMAKRSNKSPFGSVYVFPGGKLDKSDFDKSLHKYCQGLDDERASKKLGLTNNGLAYWIACIRECFEEVGILLTNKNDSLIHDEAKLNSYRQQLNAGEISFQEICFREELNLRTSSIVPCAHWITPTIEPKRFDTRFFLAKVSQEPLGMHDGFELTDSFWIKPSEAIKKFQEGNMNMLPPTIQSLEKLAEFASYDDAFNFFAELDDDAIPAILPKFIKRDGKWVGYFPGDEGYEDA
ncbi:MAG: NUDIX domain-containing protein [SAR86 cluster bacterium]|jgi:8-oxo-dGTP pyrophosphatase MutT (NUDIX family)|nr:NUDIX domain-containing protein [Pseudomonadota bacterium]MBT4586976.1 NUDIX domain-containing protein [Gammaproteobacteria bacterium]MBT5542076.1 NUDIX domain-containing protein [Gammaproteobacteria bacterium]MBT6073362.1 NUDIX domain-containing protein [Gammaproteobacteria bacterium]MDG2347046.1 NUDIX domain-containing protein [SAR86 cluster bacterium]